MNFSKGTPVPIPWDTSTQALGLLSLAKHPAQWPQPGLAPDTWGIHCGRARSVPFTTTLTVASARASNLPSLVFRKAELAGPGSHATWVVIGVLVQRDGVGGVGVAEDVPTATAVVAACKVGERAGTGWVVAESGFAVGLREMSQ
jgi:hypothetical protein